MAEMAVLELFFKHLYTNSNGVANRGARSSIPARRNWAAEMIAGSVTFCDIGGFFFRCRWHIGQLGTLVDPGAPGLAGLCFSRRAPTFSLHEFYNISVRLIPAAAAVAL
jgi:hypothetical protein